VFTSSLVKAKGEILLTIFNLTECDALSLKPSCYH
jgi:hypothetical protein